MTNITTLLPRAKCALHKRIKAWHQAHNLPADLIIYSSETREDDPQFLFIGTVADERGTTADLLVNRDSGEWEGRLDSLGVLGLVPGQVDDLLPYQTALLAATGLKDEELAGLLHVKPATARSWYSAKPRKIPFKHVETIVRHFLAGQDARP